MSRFVLEFFCPPIFIIKKWLFSILEIMVTLYWDTSLFYISLSRELGAEEIYVNSCVSSAVQTWTDCSSCFSDNMIPDQAYPERG